MFPRVFELMAESGEFDVLVSAIDHSVWLKGTERTLATNIAEDLRAAVEGTDIFPAVITVTTADPPVEDLEWARGHDIPVLKGSLPGLRALAARLRHEAYLPPPRAVPADEPFPAGPLSEIDSAAVLAGTASRTCAPSGARRRTRPSPPPSGSATRGLQDRQRRAQGARRRRRPAPRRCRRRCGRRPSAWAARSSSPSRPRAASRCWWAACATPITVPTIVVGVGGGLAEQLDLVAAASRRSTRRACAGWSRPCPPSSGCWEGGAAGLIEAVVAVSQLMAEHPEALEIDVNPLLVSGERAVALDCLIVLKETE